MTAKPRLIIVSPRQYGYQTDYLKYTEYLIPYFDVVFLCLDQGKRKIKNNDIKLKYTRIKNKKIAQFLFLVKTYIYILTHNGVVMSTNFKGCRFLKTFMPWRKMAVNIRTVSVDKDVSKCHRQNEQILHDVHPFDRIIMISEGGARQLKLPMEKVSIVSLGADVISQKRKEFDTIKLLYVGTLNNRDIIKTVIGFHKYIKQSGDIEAKYDIVGSGDEFALIEEYIRTEQLGLRIILHGQKNYNELNEFFDHSNVGVSFVPITPMYNYQPPTKTFEYINSGLFCIATQTFANSEVIIPANGILIPDNAENFCNALQKFIQNKEKISDKEIRNTGQAYLWKNIVEQQLLPALKF